MQLDFVSTDSLLFHLTVL